MDKSYPNLVIIYNKIKNFYIQNGGIAIEIKHTTQAKACGYHEPEYKYPCKKQLKIYHIGNMVLFKITKSSWVIMGNLLKCHKKN